MNYSEILAEKENSIGIITLNRPDSLNALSMKIRVEMADALENFREDKNIKALIITGKGNKAFCAGGDILHQKGVVPTGGRRRMQITNKVILAIWEMEKPVIAAVTGWAVGGGCSLALACDSIVATESARFLFPFFKIGLVPDMGTMFFLPRLIGLLRAKEILFTGREIKIEEASRLGLVNYVVPEEKLLSRAKELAEEMTASKMSALGIAKAIMNKSTHMSLRDLLEYEGQAQDILFQTEEHRTAREEFVQRRKK